MELVMWVLVDDNDKVVDQVLLSINDEEKAIDTFAIRGVKGKYFFGYLKNNGSSHISKVAKQVF
ncbi:hypothetical protein [Konateibacter massiliensis]|uniref:hypothetical protein n=1 Tax=Konateibacter massiliensis TaxID=2002841 RepID=UPI000C15E6D0|nr:hypothetical protein [Konateibacter massiliensis]